MRALLLLLCALPACFPADRRDDDATEEPAYDASLLPSGPNPVSEPRRGLISYVYDGDTFHADLDDGGDESVRVLSIDTPELNGDGAPDCWAEEARDRAIELLPEGETVWLTFDGEERDQFGRLLAYAFVGSAPEAPGFTDSFNYTMVAEGHAETFFFPNNQTFRDPLLAAEGQARAQNLGLWRCP